MVIEISRREVLNNLIRFKDNLLEMRGDEGRQFKDQKKREQNSKKKEGRSYRVLLNRHTGDMRFAQKISNLEHHFPRRGKEKGGAEDWKEIHIIVDKSTREGVHFEARDVHNHVLKPTDIDPLAWRIAKETLEVLNLKGSDIKHVDEEMLPEEAVLQDLSSIHLGHQKERIEDLPGWMGAISRTDAEQMLANQPVGTYLLREADETTESVAFNLAESNRIQIHPYLLTLVENEEKISDILFLQTNKGWTIYADDPNLKDPFYHFHSSPHALLRTLGSRVHRPISIN